MSIVNNDNIVIYCSIDEYIGFDMNANDDTLAFDALNHGATEIVQPVRHNAYSGLGDYDMYNKYAGVSLEDVGYLQVGISAKRFQKLIDEKVGYIASNRHIGQNGYVIISNSNDNSTIGAIKKLSEKEKEKLKEELNYAKSIQMSALPQNFPNDENSEIFALMEAAKGVGGDFYDFNKTFRHGLNFMIADVSGKGIPGAMFMMRSKSELHTLTETGIPVNDVFTYGNDRLCENNDTGMFVTAWDGNIGLKTGLVHFANAGHNPSIIMRKDGTCEYVKGKAGFVLAGMEGMKYELQELQMNPGDIFFYIPMVQ